MNPVPYPLTRSWKLSDANLEFNYYVNVSIEEVRAVLGEVLQLHDRANNLMPETPLVGNLPELDSMAIITVITALEEHFNIVVEDDDDISTAFETMASLIKYLESKIQS